MSFFSNIKLIADYLNLQPGEEISFDPTYHKVAQSFCPWPVVINDGGYKIRIFEWGLIADYMNTPEKIKDYRTSMANARSEKMIDDKRSVWHRLKKNRCLVFTTGFYEHRDIGAKKKLPYFIKLKGEEIFCLAGLYNYSPIPDRETGEMTGTFTVITREANSLMKTIHNSGPNSGRMPLILDKDRAIKWLDPEITESEIKAIAEYEYPADQLEAWPVNTIRTRRNDDASFIEKVVVGDDINTN
jgi:putative SOS response-associated peptidase YedK